MDYRNRAHILAQDPKFAEALDDILGQVTSTQQQTNASSNGLVTPPPPVNGIDVRASHGIYDVKIDDNSSSVSRGINYFLEYSENPAFNAPHTIDLGTSRNFRGFLGNKTLYWRASSSYPTSARSTPQIHGGATPRAVSGGGSVTGPDLLPSSGSGTSAGASGSDGGFGNQPFRGSSRPIQK